MKVLQNLIQWIPNSKPLCGQDPVLSWGPAWSRRSGEQEGRATSGKVGSKKHPAGRGQMEETAGLWSSGHSWLFLLLGDSTVLGFPPSSVLIDQVLKVSTSLQKIITQRVIHYGGPLIDLSAKCRFLDSAPDLLSQNFWRREAQKFSFETLHRRFWQMNGKVGTTSLGAKYWEPLSTGDGVYKTEASFCIHTLMVAAQVLYQCSFWNNY